MKSRPVAHPAPRRPADNELYDFGCNLVEAAAEIRRAGADPAAAPAIPAVIGCIEAALHELSCASDVLHQTSAQQPEDDRSRAVAARLERGFENLRVALEDARTAARAARSLAARSRSMERMRPRK
ncbi:MAG TPA: hypothetical protein VFZ00_27760 [Solirubrobacter sp.]|nr:hypothetical protein [Solirubrobacter sp.]